MCVYIHIHSGSHEGELVGVGGGSRSKTSELLLVCVKIVWECKVLLDTLKEERRKERKKESLFVAAAFFQSTVRSCDHK